MSKTIIIQKNGVAQTLTVDKLRLPDAAGGTENWLPADGKNLVNIEVKENGTYKASDFGAYGIAEAKVKCTLNGGAATPKATEKPLKSLHHPAPAEGGRARTMSAHHLETPQDGGGVVSWVPEDEVSLGTKSVNVDNRTYKSADDGKYGWSQFTVSGISITKTAPPGGDAIITHTDGTGTKTYNLPDHIRVEHGPLKNTYNDGETIDFFDMLVKAYNADGTIWTDETHPDGVIPLNELTLPVTVAEYTGDEEVYWTADPDWLVTSPGTYLGFVNERYFYKSYLGKAVAFYRTGGPGGTSWHGPILMSPKYEDVIYNESGTDITFDIYTLQYGGVTWYAAQGDHYTAPYAWGTPLHQVQGIEVSDLGGWLEVCKAVLAMANAVVYGTISGMQTIPVQWARPWDEQILEDGFDIFVYPNGEGTEPGFGGAEGGGGQTSGGGAGRDN